VKVAISNSPIHPFPVLETERLVLREIRDSDSSEMFKILTDRAITRLTAIPEGQRRALNRLQQRTLPEHLKHHRRERLLWAITLRGEDRFIGRCGYEEWLRRARVTEIGYWLSRSHWGQGIMTEAIAAILRYGFDVIGLQEVSAWVMDDNPASVRVLEKNGFVYDRRLEETNTNKSGFAVLHRYMLRRRDVGTSDF